MFHLIVFNLFAALIYFMREIILLLHLFTVYPGGFLKWLVSKEMWDKTQKSKDDKVILFVYLTAKRFCMLALQ